VCILVYSFFFKYSCFCYFSEKKQRGVIYFAVTFILLIEVPVYFLKLLPTAKAIPPKISNLYGTPRFSSSVGAFPSFIIALTITI